MNPKITVNTKKELKDIINNSPKTADLNHLDVSQITNLDRLFINTDFQGNISEWNVENVTSAGRAFDGCVNFNSNLSKWKPKKLRFAEYMFVGCESFNSDLTNFNLSYMSDMSHMFDGCTKFNGDVSSFDLEHTENVLYMFAGCESFNRDLSGWHLSKQSNKMAIFTNGFFKDVKTLEQYVEAHKSFKTLGPLFKLLYL